MHPPPMQHLRGQESILGCGTNPRRPLGATMGHDSVSPLFSKLIETRMDELLLRVEQCALMQPEAKEPLLIGRPRSLISGPSEPLDQPAFERRAHELLTGLIRDEVVRRGARRGRTSPVLEYRGWYGWGRKLREMSSGRAHAEFDTRV